MKIGENIKQLRKEHGITQAALAKEIGVSQKAVDYWEDGINEPKATYIARLADYFEISADVLLGRVEEGFEYDIYLKYIKNIGRSK